MAYRIAARISRSEPSFEIGLMPIEEVFGNRILLTFISSCRNLTIFFASGVDCSHSMPA
jgi:hypothetical protein